MIKKDKYIKYSVSLSEILLLFAIIFIFQGCRISKKTDFPAEETVKEPENDSLYPVELPEFPVGKVDFENAFEAVLNMKSGVNLGNGLDSTSFNEEEFSRGNTGWIIKYTDRTPSAWEQAWGQPVTTSSLIKGIKAAGFNAVRVPVTWAEHIDFETGKIDDDWMNRVKEVVDLVLAEGMYCLLNTHHDGGTDGWVEASDRCYNKYKNLYAELYRQIGQEFKDYNNLLILCGTNEIISANNIWGNGPEEGVRVVNQWNQLFVNTIRSTGGNNAGRNLMVGTYCCSSDERDLKRFIKPSDNVEGHLIMEVHVYSPKEFVWEKADWLPGWTTQWKSGFEVKTKVEFDLLKKYSDLYSIPVIIGEWGTCSRRFPNKYGKDDKEVKNGTVNFGDPKYESITDEEGAKFTSFFIRETRKYGITSFYWDCQEIVDRASGKITSPLMVKEIIKNY